MLWDAHAEAAPEDPAVLYVHDSPQASRIQASLDSEL